MTHSASANHAQPSLLSRLFKKLKGPWAIFLAVGIGGVYGIYFAPTAEDTKFIGDIYLRLLQMCVIPIIVTAISTRIGDLILKNKETLGQQAKRIGRVVFIAMLLTIIIGSLGVMGLKAAGHYIPVDRDGMGRMVSDKSSAVEAVVELEDSCGGSEQANTPDCKKSNIWQEVVKGFVPENVFEALTNFYAMQLAIFAVLLGIGIGLVPDEKKAAEAIRILDIFYEAFYKLVRILLTYLPVGLFFLIAGLVAQQKGGLKESLLAMGLFLTSFYIIGILLVIGCSALIWMRSNKSVSMSTAIFDPNYLLKPVLTSFTTMNSFATLPVAIDTLKDRMGFEERTTSLYLSLFLPLLRFGNAFYFIMAAAFFTYVYQPDFTLWTAISISAYCLLASFTTIGATSIIAIQPIIGILDQFGLPSEIGFLLLVTIDPLVDPMRTTLIVHCNTAITSMLADRQPMGQGGNAA
ncbi:MAG: cation:dicarboxylase symporter family transporter [Sulfuricellaceae bacterium]